MAAEFIYTCYKLARFYPPDRTVLENISLSFYPGAKIGVLGSNGSGKSSLLKIMAGVDDGFTGEARLTPGFTVGLLEQEPKLDAAKNVLENVMDGVAPIRDLLAEYEKVTAMWGEPDADFDKVGALQAQLESKINAVDAWSLERNVEIAMDALRCPPNESDVTKLSGGERRRVALCRLLLSRPDLLRLGDVVIQVKNLSKGYGDRLLIEDLTFNLPPAGIVGIIGANGAGKTTLFRMITGQEKPDSGSITVGDTVALSYVDQSRDTLNPENSVYQEITDGIEVMKVGNREINGRAYVASFNFKGSDQQKRVGDLSGGERNRVHLAKLLKNAGNVLLLDEPTNDLDIDTLRALETSLESFPGCVVVISHDRWFLDRIATHVLAFEGDSQVRWFEGNFTDYEAWRKKELGISADQPKRIKYKPLSRK